MLKIGCESSPQSWRSDETVDTLAKAGQGEVVPVKESRHLPRSPAIRVSRPRHLGGQFFSMKTVMRMTVLAALDRGSGRGRDIVQFDKTVANADSLLASDKATDLARYSHPPRGVAAGGHRQA